VTSTAELAARRLALLARCEAQRAELTSRIAQLSPRRWTRAAGGAVGVVGTGRSGRHPLAWLLALAAMVFLKNPRYALALLGRTRTALTWATRAAEVLSLLGALRKTTLRRTASSKIALRRAR
jgi:hypothetical protein